MKECNNAISISCNVKLCFKEAINMLVEVSLYTRVQNQISTPSNLSVFLYSYLKLSDCFYIVSRFSKIGCALVYKISRGCY